MRILGCVIALGVLLLGLTTVVTAAAPVPPPERRVALPSGVGTSVRPDPGGTPARPNPGRPPVRPDPRPAPVRPVPAPSFILTVTGVDGQTITATDRLNATVTIVTTSETTVRRGSEQGSLSDIVIGAHIFVRTARSADATLVARSILILAERFVGRVDAVGDSSVTLSSMPRGRDRASDSLTVLINSNTHVYVGPAEATLAQVRVGSTVTGEAFLNGSGQLVAAVIRVMAEQVSGTVTATTSTSVSLERQTRDGSVSETVTIGASTRVGRGPNAATLADVRVGDRITAIGFRDDAGTLAADVIQILPRTATGAVTAIADSTITLETRTGDGMTTSVTILTTGTTRFLAGRNSGSIADVAVSSRVVVTGFTDASGAIVADFVRITPAAGLRR